MALSKSVYKKIVDISVEYLGPAAERFIRRQITTHLGKRPEEITAKDIAELTSWVKLTFALLTENKELVESFADDLQAIAHKPSKQVGNGRTI